jgi:hypothetical protein
MVDALLISAQRKSQVRESLRAGKWVEMETPNSKHRISSKTQTPTITNATIDLCPFCFIKVRLRRLVLELEIWIFSGAWSLVFGALYRCRHWQFLQTSCSQQKYGLTAHMPLHQCIRIR